MGCSYSTTCGRRCTFNGVRVMHINGHMEEFQPPVTAAMITGDPPKHLLFTPAQLSCLGTQPVRPTDQLEPGRLYLMIPLTIFQSDSSPVDLATLANRLTALANRSDTVVDRVVPATTGSGGPGEGLGFVRWPSVARASTRAWRPELDTIEERSMGRSMRDSSISSSYSPRIGDET